MGKTADRSDKKLKAAPAPETKPSLSSIRAKESGVQGRAALGPVRLHLWVPEAAPATGLIGPQHTVKKDEQVKPRRVRKLPQGGATERLSFSSILQRSEPAIYLIIGSHIDNR